MPDAPVYWTDPTKREFNVIVKSCTPVEDSYHIVISPSVAKPSAGGQAGDRGVLTLGEKRISFVDTVFHRNTAALVSNSKVEEGNEAVLEVDMIWRQAMMRNHTAEHMFVSGLAEVVPDLELGSIWVDGLHGTVEVSAPDLGIRDIFLAEAAVQSAILEGHDVISKIVSPEEVDDSVRAREGVTSKHDRLRIVEIEGIDKSACSGIHVQNTKDILAFKVVDLSIGRGKASVEFKTGMEAIKPLSDIYNQILSRKREYPFEMEQIGAVLDRSKVLRFEYDQVVDTLMKFLLEGPHEAVVDGTNLRTEYLPGFDSKLLKELANRVDMEEPALLFLFAPGEISPKRKSSFVLRAFGMAHEASYYVANAVCELGGRGGGSREFYTGGFIEVDNPMILYSSIVEKLIGALVI